MPDKARQHWEKHRHEGPKIVRAVLPEILDAFVLELKATDQEVYVVLDALDEYPLRARRELLDWIQRICEKHANAHILVTSRKETDVERHLEKAKKLDVAQCVIEDLQMFIEKSIDEIVQVESWKADWKPEILERVEGVNDKYFR